MDRLLIARNRRPQPVGWLTVVLYLATAWACWQFARGECFRPPAAERLAWSAMAIGLVALGVNKQLDLRSALTELGRILAIDGGWYDSRHRVQRVFILAVGSAAALIGARPWGPAQPRGSLGPPPAS